MNGRKHALSEILARRPLDLSGERVQATYVIRAESEMQARKRAEDVCLEQTVELPGAVIDAGTGIGEHIVGRVESLDRGETGWSVRISYAAESAGREFPQLLNLLFGNVSIQPGIRLEDVELPPSLLATMPGPAFGTEGLRRLAGVEDSPLLCTALKPMGLSADELAELAYEFALGGIHLIKDDHGITGQQFAPFEERVEKCVRAVRKAGEKTGRRTLYFPSLTAPAPLLLDRARFAREAGADGLLVTPGLTGFDSLRMLATDPAISLPLMAHPSFLGTFTSSPDCGIAHGLIYALFPRLVGADALVFPNYGGRFSFTPDEVRSIVRYAGLPLEGIRSAFPVPAGGMTLDRVSEMREFYGNEAIFLMGGGLYSAGPDLVQSVASFVRAVL